MLVLMTATEGKVDTDESNYLHSTGLPSSNPPPVYAVEVHTPIKRLACSRGYPTVIQFRVATYG